MKRIERKSKSISGGRIMRVMLACIMMLLAVIALSGCKDSDALTQKIVGEPDQYETDYTLTPIIPHDAEQQNGIKNDLTEDSDVLDEQERIEPDYSSQPNTDRAAESRTQGDSLYEGESSSGDEPSSNEGTSIRGTETSDDDDASGADEAQGDGSEQEDDEGEGDKPNSSTGGEKGDVYNPDMIDDGILPEDVKKVAAAGPYATMVQALCGEGSLGAVNSAWLSSLPASAFNNQAELANVASVSAWGDGTSANDAVIEALIDSGVDAVLTSATYGGITQEGANRLAEAGIDVVVMPSVGVVNAYDADIVQAVSIIGDLFKDAEAGRDIANDSRAAARAWKTFHDNALDNAKANNGSGVLAHAVSGLFTYPFAYQGSLLEGTPAATALASAYTYYIDDWIPAKVQITGSFDVSGGVGVTTLAPSTVDNDFALYNYYFQYAGIGNPSVSLSVRDGYAGEGVSGMDGVIADDALDFSSGNTKTITRLQVTLGDPALATSTTVRLGSASFPALIVSSRDIADRIASSAVIYDEASGVRGVYNTGSDYDVLVMPSGLDGSWSDGTFESFLIAPWAQGAFASDYSISDGLVGDFYQTFYRCDASSVPALVADYGQPQHVACAR